GAVSRGTAPRRQPGRAWRAGKGLSGGRRCQGIGMMKSRFLRRGRLTAALTGCGVTAIVVAAVGGSTGALAATAPGYTVANVGAYGGEPSIASDSRGVLYDTTPSGGTITYRSSTAGKSWTQVTTADAASGDDCIDTDQS